MVIFKSMSSISSKIVLLLITLLCVCELNNPLQAENISNDIVVWKSFSTKPQLLIKNKPNSVSEKEIDIGIDELLLIRLSKVKKKQLCLKFAFKVLSNGDEPHTLLVSLISKATLNKKYIPVTDVKQNSDWYITRAFLKNIGLMELNLYKVNFEARNSSMKNTTYAYLKDIEIVLL